MMTDQRRCFVKTYNITQINEREYDVDVTIGNFYSCISALTYGQVVDVIQVLRKLGFIDENSLKKDE